MKRKSTDNNIIKALYSPKGELQFLHFRVSGPTTKFITPDDFLLQVGHLVFPKGYLAKKHRHAIVQRQIPYTAEVLIILSGNLEYNIWNYEDPSKRIAKGIAYSHEALLLGRVGHSFRSLKKSVIIEVKQGPYLGKLDKEYE